jgi:hypothetical protein
MANPMADHEIYNHNLLSEKKGFAPWFPGSVDIAEVGYVRNGGWIRLFDASKDPGDESNDLGVPNNYHPLAIGKIQRNTLSNARHFARESGGLLEYEAKASTQLRLAILLSLTALMS